MKIFTLPFIFELCAGSICLAQGQKVASATSEPAPYPRINLAPQYEVVPDWPHVQAGWKQGQIPGIAVDKDDNVWVYARTNPSVQVYASDGHIVRSWGDTDKRCIPHGIYFDREGAVWLVDCGLHVVRKFTREGKLLMTLGTLGEPGEDEHHFDKPTGVTVTPSGEIFVSDGYGNNRIVHFDAQGCYVKAWGRLGVEPGQFSIPHAIISDSKGRLYVADRNNVRVQVFSTEGTLLDIWGNILVPWTFYMSSSDQIWVCGSSPMPWTIDPKYPMAPLGCPPKDQLFMKFSTEGKVLQVSTFLKGEDEQEKPGELNWVHAIAFDSHDNLYLGDIIGRRVQKFVLKK
ncbi:MAG: hypothetical protein EBS01_02580 [Verrucomicrobia bacterium]|nr:hypothetical protein [Verrucomicrobiota bacterium]